MKYRKLPIEIEAFQFYIDNMPDWFMDRLTNNVVRLYNCNYSIPQKGKPVCEINTLEGVMRANAGDYIIKGINGELYPCKEEIFNKTYERVGEN